MLKLAESRQVGYQQLNPLDCHIVTITIQQLHKNLTSYLKNSENQVLPKIQNIIKHSIRFQIFNKYEI